MRQINFITECDRLLLQSTSGITKCDSYYKVRRNNYLNLLLLNWLTPQILGPTRIPEHQKESLIDNIYLNFTDLQCSSDNLFQKISDHLPNFLLVEDLSVLNKEQFNQKEGTWNTLTKKNF